MEDILYHWWFDDIKADKFKSAMRSNAQLGVGDMDLMFWKDL